jgi:acyl-coenzyme A synthetase/AMP-(fatty) acid ligase
MPDVINTPEGPVYSLLAEEVLMNHPDISEAVVFGVKHPEKVTVAVAVVNTKPGHILDPAECLCWVNERLRSELGLANVIVVAPEEMPRGLTGKVPKRVLRDRYANMFRTIEAGHGSRPDRDLRTRCAAEG